MNITRENIDAVSSVVTIQIEKSDYEKPVADKLKEYRQKASVPGFRPGKVPAGLIQKRFGAAVLVEEINSLLSKNLSEYISDQKLSILGEPMPAASQKEINWDKDEVYEFSFDLALSPEINLELGNGNAFDYYKIIVTDEMIDRQLDMVTSQMGKNIPAESIGEKSLARGDFHQLDENGNAVEEGIKTDGVLLSVDLIKDSEIKNSFLNLKKDDVVVFDPVKAYEDRHEVGHLLNIKHEIADELNSNFKFTITEILDFEKAELNEELFKKIYGEETEITTAEEFMDKIKSEIATNLSYSSEFKFATDTRKALLEITNIQLPELFLKRWLISVNKQLTEEQIETDFPHFLTDLKWQLIKNKVIEDNKLQVNEDEVFEFAKKMAQAQFQQYGYFDIPAEQLELFAKRILEKPEENERIYKKLFEDKVIEAIKGQVDILEKEITQEDFNELTK